ncbi:hypothetical protein ACGF07_22680 [Kitasatospora sp. NPDC048194]|uniref:hypothetical protein n=1 Tax=Kitasatospora sp. NPDC048194 TaxID=3364045 RepID=UPI00371930E0
MAWCDEPGFADEQRSQLLRRICREESGVEGPLLSLSETELFRRIFDSEGPTRERT